MTVLHYVYCSESTTHSVLQWVYYTICIAVSVLHIGVHSHLWVYSNVYCSECTPLCIAMSVLHCVLQWVYSYVYCSECTPMCSAVSVLHCVLLWVHSNVYCSECTPLCIAMSVLQWNIAVECTHYAILHWSVLQCKIAVKCTHSICAVECTPM